MRNRNTGIGSAPEIHAERIGNIHNDIERQINEATQIAEQPKLVQVRRGCRVFFDQIRALEERLGRAQSHLDSVAGSPSATGSMFQTQKRLASKVGSLSTTFRKKCMRGS